MKKKFDPTEALYAAGRNITPTALAVDELVRPVQVALLPIFRELENLHAMSIKLCWKGVVIERDGDIIYEEGRYEVVAAKGPYERAQQQLVTWKFLRWCCTHYPTPLLEKHKAWIYGH